MGFRERIHKCIKVWIKKGYGFMRKRAIKDIKKCPSCDSSNIYRRVRNFQIERNRKRKGNNNIIEKRVKHYRCNKCKREFDNPIIKQIGYTQNKQIRYTQKREEDIW